MAVTNGTGQGGKSFQDRELAAKVRSLALNEIYTILSYGISKEAEAVRKELKTEAIPSEIVSSLYPEVIKKLAGTVLPRLNEHTGADGNELVLVISGETAARYGRTDTTSKPKTSRT